MLHQEDIVHNVMTSMLRSDPPQARYKKSLDMTPILTLLKSWGPNANLSLEQIRAKAMILMRICSLSRSDDLAKIPFSSVQISAQKKMTYQIVQPKDSNHVEEGYMLPYSGEEQVLCPVEAVRTWIEKSTHLPSQPNRSLFISLKPPFKNLSAQRIAKVVKETMQQAGIDTELWKAHSLRGSSASKAAAQGAKVDELFKLARWSSYQTFQKFYFRSQRLLNMADLLFSNPSPGDL